MISFCIEFNFILFFVLLILINYKENIKLIYRFGLLFTFFNFIYSFFIFLCYKNINYNYNLVEYIDLSAFFLNIQFKFGLDGLSIFFYLLTTLLAFLSLLFIKEEKMLSTYIFSILLLEFLLILLFLTLDLFLFYIFFESLLLPMYLLIGIWGSRERKIWASYLLFFYTFCSSIFLLLGIIFIFLKVGSFEINILYYFSFSFIEQYWLWLIFFFAFGAKVPVFPFHIWLPEAHVEASTIGSVFLAGILLKLGTYGFLRFSLILLPVANIYFIPLLFTLCCLGVIYGSISAIRQSDLKRVIAYSSVAHMNLIVLGIFSFNNISIDGAIFQSFSHGLVTSSLFFLIGILYRRYHERSILYFSGLVQIMPIYISLLFISTLANIAFPLTSNFIGELLLFLGIFYLDARLAMISALSIVLGGSYSLWLYNRVSYGNLNHFLIFKSVDIDLYEFLTVAPLLILTFFFGIFPNYLLNIIHCFTNKIVLHNFFIF